MKGQQQPQSTHDNTQRIQPEALWAQLTPQQREPLQHTLTRVCGALVQRQQEQEKPHDRSR